MHPLSAQSLPSSCLTTRIMSRKAVIITETSSNQWRLNCVFNVWFFSRTQSRTRHQWSVFFKILGKTLRLTAGFDGFFVSKTILRCLSQLFSLSVVSVTELWNCFNPGPERSKWSIACLNHSKRYLFFLLQDPTVPWKSSSQLCWICIEKGYHYTCIYNSCANQSSCNDFWSRLRVQTAVLHHAL